MSKFQSILLFGMCVGLSLESISANAAPAATSYRTQADWTAHLVEESRYDEASDAVQALIDLNPNPAPGYQLRGTLALEIGSTRQAQSDFQMAARQSPQDPCSWYGLALCALATAQIPRAEHYLTKAQGCPTVSERQKDDLATALAYTALLGGDLSKATTQLQGHSDRIDKTCQELEAVLANRRNPTEGAQALTEFLQTSNGIPWVREEDGLRLHFEAANPMETSVAEPPLQKMYQIRLAGDLSDSQRRAGKPVAVSETVTLQPDPKQTVSQSLYAFYIDDHFESMVNTQPYTYRWDTRGVTNGLHRVRIDTTAPSGSVLASHVLLFNVSNQSASVGTADNADLSPEAYAKLEDRLWEIMRLRPSRKIAETLLAADLEHAGDHSGYTQHRAIAAALDPHYKQGRQFMAGLLKSEYPGAPNEIWQGSIQGNRVALTFDDGPNAAKTPALLDALDKAHVPATFFVVGSRAELVPNIVQRMHARGDEVENHSYTHPNMSQCVPQTAVTEIVRTCVLIHAMTGRYPRFFRPPGGNADAQVKAITKALGLTLGYWTLDALHYEDLGSEKGLVQYIVGHLHPGEIILMHNGSDVTTRAIPALVAAIHARGYKCVTLSEIGNAPLRQGQKVTKMKE